MDRNEKFRKRLEQRLENKQNQPIKKEPFAPTRRFDASLYVDIIFDKMSHENEDTINGFVENFFTNPDFAFIFGDSSALNSQQKMTVAQEFIKRIDATRDFNPEPYAQELSNVWSKPDFDKYKKTGKDGKVKYDFDQFFEQYNFTKEQEAMVLASFHEIQKDKARIVRRTLIPAFIVALVFVIVLPFYIPNLLQRIGWLASEAGWGIKIIIGIISLIPLFYIAKYLFTTYASNVLNKKILE